MTIHNDTSSTQNYALQYAAKGWPVFPLQGKTPVKGSAGFKDATTATAAIWDWWCHDPHYNIGFAIPDNIVVIDVDPRNGGLEAVERLQRDNGWLPQTLCAVSGRGDGGLHYYYARPENVSLVGNLARAGYAGIDLKQAGGYVVLPPSTHPDTGRPYRWVDDAAAVAELPLWLVELAERPPATPPPGVTVQPRTAIERLDAPDPSAWNGDGLVQIVTAAKPGERNNMLNWALWALKDDMLAGQVTDQAFNNCLALLLDAATGIGLDEREITSTLNSVFRGK